MNVSCEEQNPKPIDKNFLTSKYYKVFNFITESFLQKMTVNFMEMLNAC